ASECAALLVEGRFLTTLAPLRSTARGRLRCRSGSLFGPQAKGPRRQESPGATHDRAAPATVPPASACPRRSPIRDYPAPPREWHAAPRCAHTTTSPRFVRRSWQVRVRKLGVDACVAEQLIDEC